MEFDKIMEKRCFYAKNINLKSVCLNVSDETSYTITASTSSNLSIPLSLYFWMCLKTELRSDMKVVRIPVSKLFRNILMSSESTK